MTNSTITQTFCDMGLIKLETRSMKNTVGETLDERGRRYGSFIGHAAITQGLKDTMVASPQWENLSFDMKESLEMIQHKIGRILNGDPNYSDSWHDIAGYAKLVDDRLKSEGF